MSLSNAFRQLATVTEALETTGWDVETVTTPDDSLTSDDGVVVELSVRLVALDELVENQNIEFTPHDVTLTEAGELHVDFSVRIATTNDDGGSESDHDGEPAYRDPERLQAVYTEHDSFAAMRDALGVDVTPNTVRRQMIKYGIHDPETQSDTTQPDSAEAAPESTADGGSKEPTDNDHPTWDEALEDVPPDRLLDVVQTARSLQDIQHEFDLDHNTAYRLVNDLDLLNPATGDFSTHAASELSIDTLHQRLQDEESTAQ